VGWNPTIPLGCEAGGVVTPPYRSVGLERRSVVLQHLQDGLWTRLPILGLPDLDRLLP
jgi:hypothetical protein